MKAIATLTSKGQITIPQAVRRMLSLHAGDSVEFEAEQGRVEMRPARPRRISAGVLKRYLPKSWTPPSVEQMDEQIGRNLSRSKPRK